MLGSYLASVKVAGKKRLPASPFFFFFFLLLQRSIKLGREQTLWRTRRTWIIEKAKCDSHCDQFITDLVTLTLFQSHRVVRIINCKLVFVCCFFLILFNCSLKVILFLHTLKRSSTICFVWLMYLRDLTNMICSILHLNVGCLSISLLVHCPYDSAHLTGFLCFPTGTWMNTDNASEFPQTPFLTSHDTYLETTGQCMSRSNCIWAVPLNLWLNKGKYVQCNKNICEQDTCYQSSKVWLPTFWCMHYSAFDAISQTKTHFWYLCCQ